MDSPDLDRLERHLRRRYELARATRAFVGVVPVIPLVAVMGLVARDALGPLVGIGAALFAVGAGFLWYGRDVGRAVLPGLAAGLLPLVTAICVRATDHDCTGPSCMTVCIPACAIGGILAGVAISAVGWKYRLGVGYVASAIAIALLVGAMGCACVGFAGVVGLGLGMLVGAIPGLVRAPRRSRPGTQA